MNYQAGKRGRLPRKVLPLRYAHEYLVGPLPAASYPVDQTQGIANFYMLGNDQYSNCGEAGILHYEMATAIAAGQKMPVFTTKEAVAEYLQFTGGQDTGVVLADFLMWLYKKGRIKGFAPVDHNNRAVVDALLQQGHGIYSGVSLTPDADQLFNSGQPWTTANGQQPDPQEGHCVLLIKSSGPTDSDVDGYVTWGGVQPATRLWSTACLDECWLVITTEEQLAAFTPQLIADIEALHGVVSLRVKPAPKPSWWHRIKGWL